MFYNCVCAFYKAIKDNLLQKLVPSEDFASICNKFGKHNSRYTETRCQILQNNEADLVPTGERVYIDVIVWLSHENKGSKTKQKNSELSDDTGNHPVTSVGRGNVNLKLSFTFKLK